MVISKRKEKEKEKNPSMLKKDARAFKLKFFFH